MWHPCNIDTITSNISASSNTAYWSSNNLVKKSGDIMTGYLQVSQCNGNLLMGSTSDAGAFISSNQGLSMFNLASNWPYYGVGVNDGGKMNIQSYYGVTIGDKNTTTITIKDGNTGFGISNPAYKLDVNGIVSGNSVVGTSYSTTNFTQLWNDGAIMCKSNQYLRFGQVNSFRRCNCLE
jgi:hypothetical protein